MHRKRQLTDKWRGSSGPCSPATPAAAATAAVAALARRNQKVIRTGGHAPSLHFEMSKLLTSYNRYRPTPVPYLAPTYPTDVVRIAESNKHVCDAYN